MTGERDGRDVTFEIESVSLSKAERRELFARHARITHEYRDVWDETTQSVVVKFLPLTEPSCAECREVWGCEGCTTSRAITLLAIHERTIAKRDRTVSELTEALSPHFGYWRLRESGNRAMVIRLTIDEHTLIYGKSHVIETVLRNIHDEFRVWMRKVGDLSRIRSDHAWALTLDSNYYVHLTQEFDPTAPVVKMPDAPWDSLKSSPPAVAAVPSSSTPTTTEKPHE